MSEWKVDTSISLKTRILRTRVLTIVGILIFLYIYTLIYVNQSLTKYNCCEFSTKSVDIVNLE